MRKDVLKIMCCPTCKGDLSLEAEKMDEKEVIEGILACASCGVDYPINEGIPNLLPKNTKSV